MFRIGLLFKPDIKEMCIIINNLKEIEKDYKIMFHVFDHANLPDIPSTWSEDNDHLHFILCFGGDGTMLKSVESSIKYNAPVLGVNFGKLGFLSDSTFKELRQSIQDLKDRKYYIESRMLLDVSVNKSPTPNPSRGGESQSVHKVALNDVAVFKGNESKLVNIKLYANRQFVYETRSDGMVVCTPTGSTAYSLSAGGPIMSPSMVGMIVTPLNPHVLTVRPMVFSEYDTIELRLPTDESMNLQIDGINMCELGRHDRVIVKSSKNKVRFVKLSQKTFYKILRKKLNMGKR